MPPTTAPQKSASSTGEPPKDQVIRNKKNEKLAKKKTDEVANLLSAKQNVNVP
jgi:hypothetical protein